MDKFDIKELQDFFLKQQNFGKVKSVEIVKDKLLMHASNRAYIIRPGTVLGRKNFEIEKTRRKEGLDEGLKSLNKLCLDIKTPSLSALYKGEGVSLICKSTVWLNDVEDLQNVPLSFIFKSRVLTKAIVQVSWFTIITFLCKKKAYDFFCIFSDIKKTGAFDVRKVLIPRNIMIGQKQGSEKEVVFIDSDWYVTLKDTPLSGFAYSAYFKRITQGMILLVLSIIVFGISNLLLSIMKGSRNESVTYYK